MDRVRPEPSPQVWFLRKQLAFLREHGSIQQLRDPERELERHSKLLQEHEKEQAKLEKKTADAEGKGDKKSSSFSVADKLKKIGRKDEEAVDEKKSVNSVSGAPVITLDDASVSRQNPSG